VLCRAGDLRQLEGRGGGLLHCQTLSVGLSGGVGRLAELHAGPWPASSSGARVRAIFGGHTAQVSRNGIPILASPEAGPMHGRCWASLLVAAAMVLIAVGAAPLTSLLGILRHGCVITLAGLAILPSFQEAMERAFGGTLRFGALVAFLVAATQSST